LIRELKGQSFFTSPAVECRELQWSPDGKKLAVWTGKGGIDLWSTDEGAQTALIENQGSDSVEGKYTVMSFSPHGEMLQVSTDDGVSIWTRNGLPVGNFVGNSSRELNAVFAQRGQISEARWTLDGKFLAIQAPDPGGVRLIRTSDGATLSLRTVGADPGQLIARSEDGVFQGPAELENCALPAVTVKGATEKPVERSTLLGDFFEGRGIGR
jgi:WD40 repeat protein